MIPYSPQFVLPVSLNRLREDDSEMSDIMFMSVKQFDGKILKADGNVTATGEIAAVTPASGKTFYFANAKMNSLMVVAGDSPHAEVEVRNDGTQVETLSQNTGRGQVPSIIWGQSQAGSTYSKIAMGDSLDGDGIKKYSVHCVTIKTTTDIDAELSGFIEDDADSPRLPAQTSADVTITGGIGGTTGFLAKKEFDGKLFTETSTEFTTTGVKISRIVPSGESFYLQKAKVVLVGGGGAAYTGEILIHCQVKYDGTVIDNFAISGFMEEGAGEGPGWGMSGVMPETTVIGKKFDGDGVKVVTIEVIAITGTAVSGHVTLIGWEETTADSPVA